MKKLPFIKDKVDKMKNKGHKIPKMGRTPFTPRQI